MYGFRWELISLTVQLCRAGACEYPGPSAHVWDWSVPPPLVVGVMSRIGCVMFTGVVVCFNVSTCSHFDVALRLSYGRCVPSVRRLMFIL